MVLRLFCFVDNAVVVSNTVPALRSQHGHNALSHQCKRVTREQDA